MNELDDFKGAVSRLIEAIKKMNCYECDAAIGDHTATECTCKKCHAVYKALAEIEAAR